MLISSRYSAGYAHPTDLQNQRHTEGRPGRADPPEKEKKTEEESGVFRCEVSPPEEGVPEGEVGHHTGFSHFESSSRSPHVNLFPRRPERCRACWFTWRRAINIHRKNAFQSAVHLQTCTWRGTVQMYKSSHKKYQFHPCESVQVAIKNSDRLSRSCDLTWPHYPG